MKTLPLLLLTLLYLPAEADVFKCVIDAQKTVYQAQPCPEGTLNQQNIATPKRDLAKEADIEARLQAWQQDLAAKEAAERKARQELQEAMDRQEAIDALNRNAKAQQDLANATKPPVIIQQPLLINPRHRHNSLQSEELPPSMLPGPSMQPSMPSMNPPLELNSKRHQRQIY